MVVLAWLILFKFSIHIDSVLHYDKRSLNLKPSSSSSGSSGQAVENVLVFIPFGLLLSVNFKGLKFWSKLLVVLGVSIAAETIQYIFAIGATDITDVITNTVGGLIGITGYEISRKYIDQKSLDRFIVVAGSVFLGLCVVLLIALEVHHGVRYHRRSIWMAEQATDFGGISYQSLKCCALQPANGAPSRVRATAARQQPKKVGHGSSWAILLEVTDTSSTKRRALLLIDFQEDYLLPAGECRLTSVKSSPR